MVLEATYRFSSELWDYGGEASWVFVTIPVDDAADIRELVPRGRGFGSVRVQVAVGSSVWQTSIFPDASSGSYLLPVKRAIRDRERVDVGDAIDVTIRLHVD